MQIKQIFAIGLAATAASAAALPDSDIVAPFAIVNVYAAKNCAGPTTAFQEQQGQSGCFNFKGQSAKVRGFNCKVTAWTGANCKGPVGDVLKQDDTCINFTYSSVQIQC